MRATALFDLVYYGRHCLSACVIASVFFGNFALAKSNEYFFENPAGQHKNSTTKSKTDAIAKKNIPMTARTVFWRLPTTIFENTVQGITEEEKYELFTFGGSENWAVSKATRDTIELTSRPEEDSTVILTLFRQPGSPNLVVAIGTDTGSMCATELWRVNSAGRATPMATPPDPSIYDFFNTGTPIPADVTASLPFCVHPGGLEVRPLFWTSTGVAHVMVDNAVFYLWTDNHFSKRIVPLPPFEASPSIVHDELEGLRSPQSFVPAYKEHGDVSEPASQ